MTLVLTQSDFRANLKEYLDKVNNEEETIYIAGSNQRAVAVISQEKMEWLERAIKAKEGSLEYALARDQLIQRHVLPDDDIVESNDEYWNQFKA
ncbi:type II toxin-antitoxin system prevent-host-death family antitoxin [Weissella paramesenteroides]|uniref:type II toxin-antitoxin system prevent-host-death family antitoxin n=1 Tax=Weissella paramesenteroides TaxID=1249 RepID=UPI001238486B|nr:type II toxin-antitoxin system prevent-host-death family antitoxin [Weissella paramesenteroides]KAA8455492.1 type II toxin-antitoxin system Phd/YefM family antitoxin [Weissella paramesenteroides]KAA8459406.1 type II toxin-antitoxin system Phd/YefM family antitoxin [Weissella paramesenteroides]KAA8459503.1 type II toxin-antitoxin system Phd/YefM family antitoxin [Weissella paramesenteroides]KAA8460704.1 type II toxin-antitoxin system Phd/YefM family antitoxin [Weissella paramesenteroides]KAA